LAKRLGIKKQKEGTKRYWSHPDESKGGKEKNRASAHKEAGRRNAQRKSTNVGLGNEGEREKTGPDPLMEKKQTTAVR